MWMFPDKSDSDGSSAAGSGELPDDEVLNALTRYISENPKQAELVAEAPEEYLTGDPEELQNVADVLILYLNESDVSFAELADAAGNCQDQNPWPLGITPPIL